jgi:hypothetical protein
LYDRVSLLNGKGPIITGHIPVQFIVALKETQLSVRLIDQFIGILPMRQEVITSTDVHPNAVANIFEAKRLMLSVPLNVEKLKPHCFRFSRAVLVSSREIPIYAPADSVPFSQDSYFLSNSEPAIGMDLDQTGKLLDFLFTNTR